MDGDRRCADKLDTPAEFELSLGAEACAAAVPCIEGYSQYALDSQRIGGEARSLRPGEQTSQGGFRVLHAGLELQTGATTCAGAPIALARAAIWRATN